MLPIDFRNRTFNIKKLYFNYHGNRYEGSGLLNWDSRQGFKLYSKTKLKPNNKKVAYEGKLGARVFPKVNTYFHFSNNTWGVAKLSLSELDILGCITSDELIKSFYNLLIIDNNYHQKVDYPCGHFITIIDEETHLIDTIHYTSKIKNDIIFEKESIDGFRFKNEDIEVLGQRHENNLFKVNWSLKSNKYRKNISSIDYHIRNCIEIITGQTFPILGSEIYRSQSHYVKLSKVDKIEKLTFASLLPTDMQSKHNNFQKILINFLNETIEGKVTRNIFYRSLTAFKTNNYTIIEFIISNMLEGILRTLENKVPEDSAKMNKGYVYKALKDLRVKYFNDEHNRKEWRTIFKDVNDIYKKLRNKNAHQIWNDDDNLQSKRGEQNLKDLVYLFKFYGKIILAINNCEHNEPDMKRLKHNQS